MKGLYLIRIGDNREFALWIGLLMCLFSLSTQNPFLCPFLPFYSTLAPFNEMERRHSLLTLKQKMIHVSSQKIENSNKANTQNEITSHVPSPELTPSCPEFHIRGNCYPVVFCDSLTTQRDLYKHLCLFMRSCVFFYLFFFFFNLWNRVSYYTSLYFFFFKSYYQILKNMPHTDLCYLLCTSICTYGLIFLLFCQFPTDRN